MQSTYVNLKVNVLEDYHRERLQYATFEQNQPFFPIFKSLNCRL